MILHDVLARAYKSEINVEISTFWDGGWDVKLGDPMNGYLAETTILPEATANAGFGPYAVEDIAAGLERVADWFDAMIREHLPQSFYVTGETMEVERP